MSNFFLGELGAASALAGLLFVAASVNQVRILSLGLIPVQRGYNSQMAAQHRRRSARMIFINRIAVLMVAIAGAVLLWRGDLMGLYLLPVGILMIFTAVGINAWVLLIEINR